MDIKLTPEAQKVLRNLEKAGKIDLRPTFISIGEGYRKEVDMIFAHQQPRGEGLRWAPLSKPYAERKQKEYPGTPILIRTGSLFASMTRRGSPGNITAISKTQAIFGTSVSYGIYHDSDEPRKKLPRRNFSEPSERRKNIWVNQLTKDIIHNFEREGITIKGDVVK